MLGTCVQIQFTLSLEACLDVMKRGALVCSRRLHTTYNRTLNRCHCRYREKREEVLF